MSKVMLTSLSYRSETSPACHERNHSRHYCLHEPVQGTCTGRPWLYAKLIEQAYGFLIECIYTRRT